MYIPNSEMATLIPEDMKIGDRVNVHHCKPGRHNDRLYITRKENGYLYNCFHCGAHGIYHSPRDKYSYAKKASATAKRPTQGAVQLVSLPKDSTSNLSEWPPLARIWLSRGRIEAADVSKYGISYSPYYNRIFLPVYEDGQLKATIARRVSTDEKESKYFYNKLEDFSGLFYTPSTSSATTLVIVEDILSAIRVSYFLPCVALLGTHLSTKGLRKIVEDYDNYIIFLDNDNRLVKKKQSGLKARLEQFGKVRLVKESKDPKEMTDEELKEVLSV